MGIAQHDIEPVFGLAREERQPHRLCPLQVGIFPIQHRQHAGDVKAADRNLDTAGAERRGDVERARELVRLHADQHHHAGTGGFDRARDMIGPDAGVGFVDGMNVDRDILAEHMTPVAIARQAIEHRERVRRNAGNRPLDDIAVVVVMRRLDQKKAETPPHTVPPSI